MNSKQINSLIEGVKGVADAVEKKRQVIDELPEKIKRAEPQDVVFLWLESRRLYRQIEELMDMIVVSLAAEGGKHSLLEAAADGIAEDLALQRRFIKICRNEMERRQQGV